MKRMSYIVPLAVLLVSCSGTPEPAVTITNTAITTATVTTTATVNSTVTATVTATETMVPTQAPEPTKQAGPAYPSGDPVIDGYPVLVDTSSTDRRIQNWFKTAPKLVALAPGVYTAYSEVEPDLEAYLEGGGSGDCAVRKKFFPSTGGSCWDGVQAGTQEP